eukprot:695281-Pyramimonas_sp.AAC.1
MALERIGLAFGYDDVQRIRVTGVSLRCPARAASAVCLGYGSGRGPRSGAGARQVGGARL